mgnify:CR=1 FL=1
MSSPLPFHMVRQYGRVREEDRTASPVSTRMQATIFPKNPFIRPQNENGPLMEQRPATVNVARLPQQHHPRGSFEFIAGEPQEVHPLGQGMPVPALAVPVVGL